MDRSSNLIRESRVVTRRVCKSAVGMRDVIGSVRGGFEIVRRKAREGHTSYIVSTKFALTQVISADVTIYRTSYDTRGTDVHRLDRVASFI